MHRIWQPGSASPVCLTSRSNKNSPLLYRSPLLSLAGGTPCHRAEPASGQAQTPLTSNKPAEHPWVGTFQLESRNARKGPSWTHLPSPRKQLLPASPWGKKKKEGIKKAQEKEQLLLCRQLPPPWSSGSVLRSEAAKQQSSSERNLIAAVPHSSHQNASNRRWWVHDPRGQSWAGGRRKTWAGRGVSVFLPMTERASNKV